MFDLNALDWVLAVLAAFFIGISKTALSGLALLTIILMAMVFPAKASTGIVLPLLMFGDLFAVLFYRRHGNVRVLLRLFPFAVPGVVAGFFLMGRVDDALLRGIIGLIVIIMVAINFIINKKEEREVAHSLPFAGLAGTFAGFTTMVANAAGPVMIVYLLAMNVEKKEFIGTLAWFFAIINIFKLPFSVGLRLITLESLKFNALLFPAVFGSSAAGYFLLRHIPQKVFNLSVQFLAATSAVRLII